MEVSSWTASSPHLITMVPAIHPFIQSSSARIPSKVFMQRQTVRYVADLVCSIRIPVKNFGSLLTHWNSHWNSWWAHFEDTQLTVNSLDDLTLWACCELSLSLQLSKWAHCYHCMVSSSGDLTNSSWQAQGVSRKLTEVSQQAHSVNSSCEFAVS